MTRLALRVGGAAALLLALGVSGLMCARVAERGRYATAYSTYSAGPEGARALYELAHALGHPTERWVEDLEGLPERGVLIALGGCLAEQRRPLSRYERERLAEWVRRGGTLMVFGADTYVPVDYPAYLVRAPGQCHAEALEEILAELSGVKAPAGDDHEDQPAGPPSDQQANQEADQPAEPAEHDAPSVVPFVEDDLEVWRSADDEDDEPVYLARAPDGPLADLAGVPMTQPSRVAVAAEQTPVVLALFGERRAAIAVTMGAGRLVLFASGSMLTNQAVLDQRGGVLFARLLEAYATPGATVVFDEYHLGTGGTRSLVRYLRQVGVGAVLLQLLLLGALSVLRSGRRLGELEEPAAEVPGGTVSYVAATGALYSRSPDRGGIARVLLMRALDRVATHHRIRARQPEQMVEQLRTLGRVSAATACETLLLAFAEPVLSEKALVALSKRVDALVTEACAPAAPSASDPYTAVTSPTSPLEASSS